MWNECHVLRIVSDILQKVYGDSIPGGYACIMCFDGIRDPEAWALVRQRSLYGKQAEGFCL